MANGHGGARNNSGRKSKRIKFAGPVGKLDKKLAAHVEKAAANLIQLADGGYERVTRVMKMAGSLTRSEFVEKEGPRGGIIMLRKEVPMFPDLPPETLICVEERREWADPDRAANEYIIDRIAGRPGQMDEPEDDKNGGAKVTDDARKKALEKMTLWRQKSQEQLVSIRNPMNNLTLSESESSENEASSSPESSTMDEF